MRRFLSALIALGLLAFVSLFAYRATRPEPRALAFDLADRLPYSARTGARDIIVFGWPGAEPHLIKGFGGDPESRGRERFMWVRQGATLKVDTAEVRDRALVFDIEAYQGIEDQRLSISVNGHALGVQEIPATRSRVRFEWPAMAQSATNELSLEFARSIVPANEKGGSGDTRDFAAALFSLTVGDPKDASLDLLRERETPRAFEVSEKDSVPSFVLPGAASTSFAFRLPEDATLEFECALLDWSAASGGKGTLQISFDAADGRKRDMVSVPLGTQTLKASRVSLKGDAGTPFIVRMEINSEKPGLTFATIRAPRIMANAPPPPPQPSPAVVKLTQTVQTAKPNVLLIVLDAGRAKSFGIYGNPRATTPNIDRFAREGFTFENAYTTAAYTLAAMSSVWTSQQPDRHHGDIAFAAKLPADRLLLAEVLTAQGVHTAGFVANPVAGSMNGLERGFKEYDEPFKKYGTQASSFRNVMPTFLDRMKKEGTRFFAYVHYREPHEPYDPPPPFNTQFGPDTPIPRNMRDGGEVAKKWLSDVNSGAVVPTPEQLDHLERLYDGNLAFADSEIGYLRAELESRGLLDNTIVIVTGDHGEALYEHGHIGHNAQVFEETAHIPLIVSLPVATRTAYPPARVSALVDLTDIAPTVLDVFDLQGTGGSAKNFQGRSLLGPLSNAARSTADDTREIVTRTLWARPVYSVRNTSHTFIYNTATEDFSLYDRSSLPRLEDKEHDYGPRAPVALRETYRQNLLAWVASLKRRAVAGDKAGDMPCEQCQQLKALGYIDAKTPCKGC